MHRSPWSRYADHLRLHVRWPTSSRYSTGQNASAAFTSHRSYHVFAIFFQNPCAPRLARPRNPRGSMPHASLAPNFELASRRYKLEQRPGIRQKTLASLVSVEMCNVLPRLSDVLADVAQDRPSNQRNRSRRHIEECTSTQSRNLHFHIKIKQFTNAPLKIPIVDRVADRTHTLLFQGCQCIEITRDGAAPMVT